MIGPSEEGPISDTEAKYKLQYIIKFKIENHRITAVLWPSAVLHLLPRLREPPNRLQQQYEQSRTSSLVAISSTAFVFVFCFCFLYSTQFISIQFNPVQLNSILKSIAQIGSKGLDVLHCHNGPWPQDIAAHTVVRH